MKAKILVPILLLIVAAVTGEIWFSPKVVEKQPEEQKMNLEKVDWVTYENKDFEISIEYPSDWEMFEIAGGTKAAIYFVDVSNIAGGREQKRKEAYYNLKNNGYDCVFILYLNGGDEQAHSFDVINSKQGDEECKDILSSIKAQLETSITRPGGGKSTGVVEADPVYNPKNWNVEKSEQGYTILYKDSTLGDPSRVLENDNGRKQYQWNLEQFGLSSVNVLIEDEGFENVSPFGNNYQLAYVNGIDISMDLASIKEQFAFNLQSNVAGVVEVIQVDVKKVGNALVINFSTEHVYGEKSTTNMMYLPLESGGGFFLRNIDNSVN